MKTKRTYRTTDVEKVDVGLLIAALTARCIIAIDIAKTKMVAAIASAAGEVLQLVRFDHPRQTAAFLRMVLALRDAQLEPAVVMEPTGTYGDSLRHQCHVLGVPVSMIAPKHTHDFAEVLDGVPSMHDAKAAVVLARLAAFGKGKRWAPDDPRRRELRALVEQRHPLSITRALYHGHLESMLARHWPEFGEQFDVYRSSSALALLNAFPGPKSLADAPEREVAAVMRKASRNHYSADDVAEVIQRARGTFGEPMAPAEEQRLRAIALQLTHVERYIDDVDAKLAAHVERNDEMRSLAAVVGPACAAAIGSHLGSLREYASASAVEKAMGLNLKERSSGETKGALRITKRGPSHVRHLLYLATLRLLKSDGIVRAWYQQRKSYRADEKGKHKAVVAVMRKLARALFHIARGEEFNPCKLFDVQRLEGVAHVPAATTHTPVTRIRRARVDARNTQGGTQPQT